VKRPHATTTIVTEVLLARAPAAPGLLPTLGPLAPQLTTAGREAFGGHVGPAGTAWNLHDVRGLNRSTALSAMRALHSMLTWDTGDPGDGPATEPALHDLIGRLTEPGVTQYVTIVEHREPWDGDPASDWTALPRTSS